MAEGVLRHLAQAARMDLVVDSAGTIASHTGEAPDERAQACMREHGLDIHALRARKVLVADLHTFDLILAMDEQNLKYLQRLATSPELAKKVRPIMAYAKDHPASEVPDPYYGGAEGFEQVYGMLMLACRNVLRSLATHV
jgi:protein-tyrosine phosphatase